MEAAQFKTTTIPKYYLIHSLIWGLCAGIIGTIALYIFMPMYAMLFAAMMIGVEIMLVFALKGRPEVILRFEGDELHIRNSDYKDYEVYAVPASTFVFKQTTFEKKRNIGRVRIKGTIFEFYGVQDFENTKQYVRDHFPNR